MCGTQSSETELPGNYPAAASFPDVDESFEKMPGLARGVPQKSQLLAG